MSQPATSAQWRAALKAEGVPFIEHPGWTTRGRDQATGNPFGEVYGILNHHTAGRDSLALIATTGRPGLPPPLAHALLRKDGVVVLIAAGRANHAGLVADNVMRAIIAEQPLPKADKSRTVDGNDRLYGLEVENLGNGEDVYTRAQYDSWVRFDAALCRLHGWNERSAAGHLETSVEGKVDPAGPVEGYGRRGRFTFTMGRLRGDVAERLRHPASWSPTTEENDSVTPGYVNLGLADGYELAPGVWKDIAFTAEWADEPGGHAAGDATVVKGPATFTGSLSLRFEGLDVGEVVQVRMAEYDNAGALKHSHPIHEITGTRGGSFGVLPLAKRIGAGRNLRVRLLNQGPGPIEVASAIVTALVWEG